MQSEFTVICRGTDPLLVHNARLSDPLDEIARAMSKVSGKRKKTDEDHEELARLEHMGGLYFDAELGPYMPGQNIERMLVDAAKKFKLGTTVKAALTITEQQAPIIYQGPRTVEGLWSDKKFVHRSSVKIGQQRVMRTRPVFPAWEVHAVGQIDTSQIDQRQLEQVIDLAGGLIGLGDWRPRFGRFAGEVKWT